jgi:hypothetical protein
MLLIQNNMKSLLIEVNPLKLSPQTITESLKKNNGSLIVETLLATAEVKNGNGRYYPKELWEREIDRYNKEAIQIRNAVGELDHPDSQVINLKNVSHLITDIWWNGDKIFGKIEILPTPSGNIVKNLLESGITIGVSSRGMGSLKQVGEVLEVQDDFSILCWDIVSNPSNPNSWIKSSLNESVGPNVDLYNKVNSIITEILCSQGSCPIW